MKFYKKYDACKDLNMLRTLSTKLCIMNTLVSVPHLHLILFEVVVYEGVIREKPSSKEEARHFIKGLLTLLCYQLLFSL